MISSTTSRQVVDTVRRYGLALLAFALVLLVSFERYHSTVQQEQATTHTRFQLMAQEQIARLRERTDELFSHADVLQHYAGQGGSLDPQRFARLLMPMVAHNPEIASAGILRRHADGAPVEVLQVTGATRLTRGADFPNSEASPDADDRRILLEALRNAPHTATGTATLPVATRDIGGTPADTFLIFAPVREDPDAPPGNQQDAAFLEIRLSRLIDAAFQPAINRDVNQSIGVEVLDATDEARTLLSSPGFRPAELTYADAVPMGNRRWLVIIVPDGPHYSLSPSADAGGQLFAGFSLAALIAFMVYVLQSRTEAIRHRVAEQTVALAEANDALGQYVNALGETNRLLENEVDKHARAEALLRETTSLQRAILDCAEYAIIYTDTAGIIRVLNPAAERLFGYRAEDVIGRDTPLIFYTAEDIAGLTLAGKPSGFAALAVEPLNGAADTPTGAADPREVTLRRRDGETFPANIVVSTVRDASRNVRGYLGIVADITQRRAAESRIRHLAHYDNLTSLPNRTLLNQHLTEVIEQAAVDQRRVAVLFTDLDRFKYVNDTLGHQAGDQLLLSVAQRLRGCVRDGDLVARTGGDEFVVVLSRLEHAGGAEEAAGRILTALARPFELCGQQFTVTPSIGIALYPNDGLDGEALIKNADAAMYLAKERGRNNFQFFDHGLSERYSERLELEARLRQALQAREFELYYQPQVDTLSGEIIGMEALIRWPQPDGSLIPPDKFIPIAEECGLIVPIGAWVLEEACRQNQAWIREGIARVPVGVNLSARQFDDKDLLDTIKSALDTAGLAPAYLDLELTESLVMRNPEHTRNLLVECKRLGLQLSVDDFGTGYSSLANLKRFPIDRLKIDRSFIKDIASEPDDATIAQTIVAMAHTLRLEVIAEGVETEAQLALLRRWRCDAYQGYLCSRPINAAAMTQMLRNLRASRLVSLTAL
ncbi:MAG TPA: EAL domain-containing protein [Rhodocyclaceae bacterium]|nr:EAL domain-containing protein [Rhodocyclaceae bacterium]